jgi:sec-independent protein translocase protein TatC
VNSKLHKTHNPHGEMTLLEHLGELRTRLLRAIVAVLIAFVPLAFVARHLYTLFAQPLLRQMPAGTSMIATEVTAPFIAPIKLAFVAAFFVAIPYCLHQLWAFIAPGLYQNEKRFALPLVVLGTVLFYAGAAFAYFVVLPLVFGVLTAMAPHGVAVMTDMTHYLNFMLAMFIAFGAAFQVPIATVLLVWAGITTPAALGSQRGYVLIGCFAVAMFLTPPDVFSQTFLAVPMYGLFELGIVLARTMVPQHETEEHLNH